MLSNRAAATLGVGGGLSRVSRATPSVGCIAPLAIKMRVHGLCAVATAVMCAPRRKLSGSLSVTAALNTSPQPAQYLQLPAAAGLSRRCRGGLARSQSYVGTAGTGRTGGRPAGRALARQFFLGLTACLTSAVVSGPRAVSNTRGSRDCDPFACTDLGQVLWLPATFRCHALLRPGERGSVGNREAPGGPSPIAPALDAAGPPPESKPWSTTACSTPA